MLSLVEAGVLIAARPVSATEVLAGPIAAEVVEVTDGDTVVVRARIWLDQEVLVRARLATVDAPELDGRCARERALARRARALVAALVADGAVELSAIRYDKYGGCVFATIATSQGQDVATALVAAGLAHPYSGGRRRDWCGG